jgi:dihydrofolate reductase
MVSLIVAVAENGGIGKNNDLLWHLPADMKFFKETTNGHAVITGRKNYESIPEKFRPLPNRTNIVLTRNAEYAAPGAIVKHDLTSALEYCKSNGFSEVFIIGGAEIYKLALEQNLVDRMYITHVHVSPDADAFFLPDYAQWKKVKSEFRPSDEKNVFAMDFCIYEK